MAHKFEDKINRAVRGLLNNYSEGKIIDKVLTFDHPDRDRVIDILKKLQHIIMAGYFKSEGLRVYTLENNLRMLLEDVIFNLVKQISVCLVYGTQKSVMDVEVTEKAEAITFQFVDRIPKIREYIDTDVIAAYDGDPAAYSTDEVRDIAKRIGLTVADKPDSQEICFIPDHDYGAFLEKQGEMPGAGDFVDKEGNILGKHKGIHHYTIGQRKGLDIAFGKPMYVCEIRPETNEVVLGDNDDKFTWEVLCTDVNHMAVTDLSKCDDITAKIRYGSREYGCHVEYLDDGYVKCRFDDRARAVTPGQAIVFYQDNIVFGGGRIVRSKLFSEVRTGII